MHHICFCHGLASFFSTSAAPLHGYTIQQSPTAPLCRPVVARPVVVPFRRFATGHGCHVGALPFIQLWLGACPRPFFQGAFRSVFYKPPTYPLDRRTSHVHRRHFVVRHAFVCLGAIVRAPRIPFLINPALDLQSASPRERLQRMTHCHSPLARPAAIFPFNSSMTDY
jgi:hypothetical protein